MELKNLFEPSVKKEIIDRINTLTPETKALWSKMNVAQMLAHARNHLVWLWENINLRGIYFSV